MEIIEFNYYGNSRFILNLGYEKRFYKRKLSKFFGVDMLLGKSINRYEISQVVWIYDTTISSNAIQRMYDISRENWTTHIYQIGIAPFIGLMLPISERLIISTHLKAELSYGLSLTHYYNSTSNVKNRYSGISRDFNTSHLLNDISVFYRF